MGPTRITFKEVVVPGLSGASRFLYGPTYSPVNPGGWRIEGVGVELSVGYPNLLTIHTWDAEKRPRLNINIGSYQDERDAQLITVLVSGDITYSGPQAEWEKREEAKTRQGQIAQLERKIKELEASRVDADKRIINARKCLDHTQLDREKLEEDISAVYAQLCELRRESDISDRD